MYRESLIVAMLARSKVEECAFIKTYIMFFPKKPKKTKKKLLEDRLDRVFSEYIRLRDTMPNGYCQCISCGKIKPYKDFDAGHYFSRRHMATRWDEKNVNAECKACNRFDSEHLEGYREHLIHKIGERSFAALKIRCMMPCKYEEFELEELIKYYKNEVAKLKKDKGL